jgi:hypothetical protein
MKDCLNVALVLTAGAKREIYDTNGKPLPFWYLYPPFKNKIKEWERIRKVFVIHEESLKGETIARLEKAARLFFLETVDFIISVGGYSPGRLKLGLKDSVELMNEWLADHGVSSSAILGGNVTSVDTGTNIEEFIKHLRRLEISQKLIIYLVTSWYHVFRARIELKAALRRRGIDAIIINISVFPDLNPETLRYEYLWNIVSEFLIKIPGLLFPRIKIIMREREYKVRRKTLHS